MYQYTYVKAINSSRLIVEISTAGLPDCQISTAGTAVFIEFTEALSSPQIATLGSVVSAHVVRTMKEIINEKINDAIDFGMFIMKDFVTENVQLGITQKRLTGHIRKSLREVKDALETGSIYDAITEIKALNPADFDNSIMTPARILEFRNKIEVWLEVPLATSWNQDETWL